MDPPYSPESEEILAEPEGGTPSTNALDVLIFLQSNGWYILILSGLLYWLWKSKISHFYQKRQMIRDTLSKCKKDPDIEFARETARMAARERLQNSYNEQAAKAKVITEEKEERKRQAYIAKLSATLQGRKLNDDYNPLMGKGGPSYRSSRRTCPGGPCGSR